MKRRQFNAPTRRPAAHTNTTSRSRPLAAAVLAASIALVAGACSEDTADSGAAVAPTGPSSTVAPPASSAEQRDLAGTFDIGGRDMYLECTGQGAPTVVLISGGGIAADLWNSPLGEQPTVYPTIAKTTRVCAYDRPGTTRARAEGGFSRSDPVAQPVTPSSSVDDLHALLSAAGESGPFVLAAHSYGGLVARLFAHQFPTEVAGMVLVDSFSPELRDAMPQRWAAWIDWNTTRPEILEDYPDYERVDFDQALDEIVANRSIPPMPLVVLSADEPYPAPTNPDLPADIATVTREAQDVSQRQVAQLVPGAEHITETHSGHDIMLHNPVLVSDAIVDVVDAVRAGRTSLGPTTPAATTTDVAATDTISPLIITALSPNPTPFKGTDDLFHVAYELTVLNFSPAPSTITAVDTVAPDGTTVASLSQHDVAERMMILADYSSSQPAKDAEGASFQIPSGKTAILVLDDVYPSRSEIPESVTHRITARFGDPESGEGEIAVLWPTVVTQTGGIVTADGDAVQIGAPLTGPGWVINNGCCTLNAHRNVVLPVAGRINGAERFAIDASRIDVAASAAGPAGDDLYIDGDPTKNESNRSYGAPILAVADATVVAVTADIPDTPPGTLPLGPGFTLANLGGNAVVLELAPDLYAIYYHLAPGSPTVHVGDRVNKGDVIATLGNSGNSSAAHLHFQLSRSPLIFSSDSVAFVFDHFTVMGSLDPANDRLVPQPAPGPRQAELPMATNVIDFP